MKPKKSVDAILLQGALLAALAVLLTSVCIQTEVGTYVTTMYAFTYNHGFLPRGVMGTVLWLLDLLLPFDLYTYAGVRLMCYLSDVFFVGLLLLFFMYCLKQCRREYRHAVFVLCFMFGSIAFPEFIAFQNFGRTDAVCAALTLIMVWLIAADRWIWLCVPLCGLGVMIHQGFVLQFIGPVLALLFYRTMMSFDRVTESSEPGSVWKSRGMYCLAVAVFCVILSGVLFLFLNFHHPADPKVYEQVLQTAGSLANPAYNGEVHKQLLMHEILGEDPATDEWQLHVRNFQEGLIFFLMTLPYTIILTRFLIRIIRSAKGGWKKLGYVAVSLGASLILPDFLFKIDFGRWVFSVIFYYTVTILALFSIRDEAAEHALEPISSKAAKHPVLMIVLVLAPLLVTPLGDVWITWISSRLAEFIFG